VLRDLQQQRYYKFVASSCSEIILKIVRQLEKLRGESSCNFFDSRLRVAQFFAAPCSYVIWSQLAFYDCRVVEIPA